MADEKISELAECTDPQLTDLFGIVDGSDTKKLQGSNLLTLIALLTELAAAPHITEDYLVVSDNGTPKKIHPNRVTTRYVSLEPFSFKEQTDTEVADAVASLHIPPDVNGLDLVYVHLEVETAGITDVLSVQIYNATQAANMLSTEVTVDSTETGSDTAATPYVIDTGNDDVATNDVIEANVTAIHSGTAAKGLIITLGFA